MILIELLYFIGTELPRIPVTFFLLMSLLRRHNYQLNSVYSNAFPFFPVSHRSTSSLICQKRIVVGVGQGLLKPYTEFHNKSISYTFLLDLMRPIGISSQIELVQIL